MKGAATVLVVAGLLMATGCGMAPADRLTAVDPAVAPVVTALAERDPAALDALVRNMDAHAVDARAVRADLKVRPSSDVETARVRLHAHLRADVLPVFVSRASDDAVRDYAAATLAELEALRDRSYYRCHAFLFGDRSDDAARIELENALPPTARGKSLRALAALIESARDAPVPVDDAVVNDALDRVVLPLMPARYSERVVRFRASDVRILDTATACDVTIDLFRVVVDLPPPDGPLLRRHLLLRLTTPESEADATP